VQSRGPARWSFGLSEVVMSDLRRRLAPASSGRTRCECSGHGRQQGKTRGLSRRGPFGPIVESLASPELLRETARPVQPEVLHAQRRVGGRAACAAGSRPAGIRACRQFEELTPAREKAFPGRGDAAPMIVIGEFFEVVLPDPLR
jgi:hypothetical protein